MAQVKLRFVARALWQILPRRQTRGRPNVSRRWRIAEWRSKQRRNGHASSNYFCRGWKRDGWAYRPDFHADSRADKPAEVLRDHPAWRERSQRERPLGRPGGEALQQEQSRADVLYGSQRADEARDCEEV